LQASNAFLSAGAASPDEFYDLYAMDLEAEGQWARARRRFMRHRPSWTRPVRAAGQPASVDVLWEDARAYAFGGLIGYGGSTAVAATGGNAHPLWIDTGDLAGKKQEILGATLP
jgi:hypothetical protein